MCCAFPHPVSVSPPLSFIYFLITSRSQKKAKKNHSNKENNGDFIENANILKSNFNVIRANSRPYSQSVTKGGRVDELFLWPHITQSIGHRVNVFSKVDLPDNPPFSGHRITSSRLERERSFRIFWKRSSVPSPSLESEDCFFSAYVYLFIFLFLALFFYAQKM